VLRKAVQREHVNELWQKGRSDEYPRKRHCPACGRMMAEAPLEAGGAPKHIDVCKGCHFIWFDAGELEALPKAKAPRGEYEDLPMETREAMALAKIEAQRREREGEEIGLSTPENWWEIIPAMFGIPIEYESPELKHRPLATWGLAAAIVIVSVMSLFNIEQVVDKWGLIPAQAGRYFGFTFVSSFFLHAGILHLIVNVAFLLVFGDNVEDVLGKLRFLGLVAAAAFVGSLAHIAWDPRAEVACVGASGGISGIVAYYCLRFPRAKFGILIFFRWVRLPAGFMLVFWIIFQASGAMQQFSGFGDVSALSHLGGAVTGAVFWWVTRQSP
jgi:membrane associated rhomboid family serine protease